MYKTSLLNESSATPCLAFISVTIEKLKKKLVCNIIVCRGVSNQTRQHKTKPIYISHRNTIPLTDYLIHIQRCAIVSQYFHAAKL